MAKIWVFKLLITWWGSLIRRIEQKWKQETNFYDYITKENMTSELERSLKKKEKQLNFLITDLFSIFFYLHSHWDACAANKHSVFMSENHIDFSFVRRSKEANLVIIIYAWLSWSLTVVLIGRLFINSFTGKFTW